MRPEDWTSTDDDRNDPPVLFLIWKRPDHARKVFEQIRKKKPSRLYIGADGPREDKNETELCNITRDIALDVDWPCKVRTLFRKTNLGSRDAVSGAIDWFFENEREGIILEDDCVPDDSFFNFCGQLLDRYRKDSRIMHIGGDNFQFGKQWGPASYYFSMYNHIWGWATWRRAWRNFDKNMLTYPDFKNSDGLSMLTSDKHERKYWTKTFDCMYLGTKNVWDFQWTYAIWKEGGLSITPQVNLVTNIGYAPDALHTRDPFSRLSNVPSKSIGTISHPKFIIQNKSADIITYYNYYHRSLFRRSTNFFLNGLRFKQL